MERLFTGSDCRLKWGDTKLSINDIQFKNDLKVDLRIIFDENIQNLNQETDLAVAEAAKYNPGVLKFQSDQCKLLIECKLIIDMFIRKGFEIDNINCIQICGLEVFILNLSLSAPGVYVATEVFHGSITNSLSDLKKMFNIASNLLCFKRSVITVNNKYVDFKNSKKIASKSSKKSDSTSSNTNTSKMGWTRGTWVAFRSGNSSPPPPNHLTA